MNKECEFCKDSFTTENSRKRFCSKNCSKYSWNKRNNFIPKIDVKKKKEYDKKYREENVEKIIDVNKKYYILNKDRILNRNKEYRENNAIKVAKVNKQWKKNNKDKIAKYAKYRYDNDIEYSIKSKLRSRFNNAIKNNQKAGSAVNDLGCSIEFLKTHLESLFEPGMTWENRDKWHIDHIEPLSKFDLTNREELLKACNYTNLQPLWAIDNLKKGNKY